MIPTTWLVIQDGGLLFRTKGSRSSSLGGAAILTEELNSLESISAALLQRVIHRHELLHEPHRGHGLHV